MAEATHDPKLDALRKLAEDEGALAPGLSVTRRAALLRRALQRARGWSTAHVAEPEPGTSTLVVFVPTSNGASWSRHLLDVPPEPRAWAHEDARSRQDFDDASISGIADLLEAKARGDDLVTRWGVGLPGDPDLAHDAVELLFRSTREAVHLATRAQKALLSLVDGITPAAPRPVRARQLPREEIVVRWPFGARKAEHAFTITNRSSQWLRPRFAARVRLEGDAEGDALTLGVTTMPAVPAVPVNERVRVTLTLTWPGEPPTVSGQRFLGSVLDVSPAAALAPIPLVIEIESPGGAIPR